jgi:hypothetical protein
MAVKLSVTSLVNVASASARSTILICPIRSLIERAEENSLATQSLFARLASGLSSNPVLHPLGLRLIGQDSNQQRGVQIKHQ